MQQIFKHIQAIIRRLYGEGHPEKIKAEVSHFISTYNTGEFFGMDYIALMKAAEEIERSRWLMQHEGFPADIFTKNDLLKILGDEFAKTKAGISTVIANKVRLSLSSDEPLSAMIQRLQRIENNTSYYAETIARTARLGANSIITITKSVQLGARSLKYEGPDPEREFCIEHLLEVHPVEQWAAMSNDFGQPVLIYRGGWNCRHRLIGVN